MNDEDNLNIRREVGEDIKNVSFRDYYIVSREFKAENEKGVGVLEGLSNEVFNSLFSIDVKSVKESVEDIDMLFSSGKEFDLDSIVEELGDEGFKIKNLEEDIRASGKVKDDKNGSDFYKTSGGIGDLYSLEEYDEDKSPEEFYDELINEGKVESFVSPEDERGAKRSMLEIAGFRDEEAEKNREDMRRLRWG